jgi:hypothetical protein
MCMSIFSVQECKNKFLRIFVNSSSVKHVTELEAVFVRGTCFERFYKHGLLPHRNATVLKDQERACVQTGQKIKCPGGMKWTGRKINV